MRSSRSFTFATKITYNVTVASRGVRGNFSKFRDKLAYE